MTHPSESPPTCSAVAADAEAHRATPRATGDESPQSSCRLVPAAEAAELRSGESVLLGVTYGSAARGGHGPEPRLDLPHPVLSGRATELWVTRRPVRYLRSGDLHCADDGARIAGILSSTVGTDPERSTRDHFHQLLGLLRELGDAALVRVWNYLPGINLGIGDCERYRRFNAGRARAFDELYGSAVAPERFSASSAVGAPGEDLLTVFLAERGAVLHLENRRQVPADHYPLRYGPRAPSFRRATLARDAGSATLFVSGTASIVGHETRHPGRLEEQIGETVRNLAEVVAEARRRGGLRVPDFSAFDLVKVYLRRSEDLVTARARLAGRVPADTVWLLADICRGDLDIEIEGVAVLDGTGSG